MKTTRPEGVPEFCPITGLPFLAMADHPAKGNVPTYGGPRDSYTIPEWSSDMSGFVRTRFDHERGDWVDRVEVVEARDFVKELRKVEGETYDLLTEAEQALWTVQDATTWDADGGDVEVTVADIERCHKAAAEIEKYLSSGRTPDKFDGLTVEQMRRALRNLKERFDACCAANRKSFKREGELTKLVATATDACRLADAKAVEMRQYLEAALKAMNTVKVDHGASGTEEHVFADFKALFTVRETIEKYLATSKVPLEAQRSEQERMLQSFGAALLRVEKMLGNPCIDPEKENGYAVSQGFVTFNYDTKSMVELAAFVFKDWCKLHGRS